MPKNQIYSIGLFIDGGYFMEMNKGLHPQSKVNLKGMMSHIRTCISEKFELPREACIITESHYFQGRFKAFEAKQKQNAENDLKHDIGKLMTCGCTNYILDRLAGQDKKMNLKIRISSKKVKLPGFIEFELTDTYCLSARYLVNKCPGNPQLEAWVNPSVKQIFDEYPAFAYIQRV